MEKVIAENTEYLYFSEADGYPSEKLLDSNVVGIPSNHVREHVLAGQFSDMRLALIRFPLQGELFTYFLHWDTNVDLLKLDQKVLASSYTDRDFEDSIKTQLLMARCSQCNWEGYALVVPPGDPYIGAPGLDQKKVARRYARHGFKNCPNCGAKFTQDVVKIFPSTV